MKAVTTATTDAWLSGDYTGTKRPMARVTVQKLEVTLVNYDITEPNQDKVTKKKDRRGKFASLPFGQLHQPLEIPNLASVRWARSVDDPIASCTLEFFNAQDPLPLGTEPPDDYTFDLPGWFTYNRGLEGFSSRWGYEENGWRGLIAPDRILRTYEGYGFDETLDPASDPNMNPSGVWVIDDVQYTADGMIRVQCRDLGRALIDQICFPPVVPWAEYPLIWERLHREPNPPRYVEVSAWKRPVYETDSNVPYVGTGITDGGTTYVSPDGSVRGHHGTDAFDGSTNSYWLSVGNQSYWSSAYEYVQGWVPGHDVSAVKVKVYGGSYHGYVSVKVDGVWKGAKTIPYRSRVIDTNADIRYVKSFNIGKNDTEVIKLPRTYQNVEAIRVTFSRLWNSGIGVNYKYRAGVKDVQYSTTVSKEVDSGTHLVGNFTDYTDIVKWFLAWGGFYWPKHSGTIGLDFIRDTTGDKTYFNPGTSDPVLPATPGGRIWGDFEQTGIPTPDADTPPITLGVEVWDKKTLLDCINYIRDIVGFLFVIGEDGGVIWRQPNIWALGNYIWDPLGQSPIRDTDPDNIIVIDEKQTLIDLTTKLSSRNLRERVFVGNVAGDFGAVARGFRPKGYGTPGLRRVAGWTDQRFENVAECQRMADLITLRQLFSYRENELTIAANPAIQIDDQVRIYERITNEGFIHYVKAISSSWNLADGEWTYQLTTHWLGEDPFDTWAFNPGDLNEVTQAYLRAMGKIP